MKEKRSHRLRFHLLIPLGVTFLVLWVGAMLLLTRSTDRRLMQEVQTVRSRLMQEYQEQMGFYERNLAKGLGVEADRILIENLTNAANAALLNLDGGVVVGVMRADGTPLCTQIALGYAHEAGVDQGQRWQLRLDDGLDDEGQLALARWITAHRKNSWEYNLWPSDSHGEGDGSIMRVTGEELPGYAIQVERMELVHPDGTVELMVETNSRSPQPKTWEFRYLTLRSALLPTLWSSGRESYTNMEQHLANIRRAQEGLHPMLGGAGDQSVDDLGSYDGNGDPIFEMTFVYDTWPAAVREMHTLYGSTFLYLGVVLLVLSQVLSRKVAAPVEKLCRQVQEGRCRADGPVQELNTLAATFNQAQEKLEERVERERDFTRAAAHELKTPLAVLRTHTEALQEDILPEKREHYLDVVLEETDRMAQLVSHLLELSRLEAGAALTCESVDLGALVRKVFQPLTLPLERKGMTLTMDLGEGCWLSCDKSRIREAVENLASNALRYGAEGGGVQVRLEQTEDQLCLTVENDGPAIPEEALPHLFEPFYRVDRARSRVDGGTGLGLAIVKAAVEAHGGRCTVENRPGGVRTQIQLPRE